MKSSRMDRCDGVAVNQGLDVNHFRFEAFERSVVFDDQFPCF